VLDVVLVFDCFGDAADYSFGALGCIVYCCEVVARNLGRLGCHGTGMAIWEQVRMKYALILKA
jgi:hypothetical protein